MANMLSLKRRIKTAQNVSKTTRAMQMIAASKLKRAQTAATLSKTYVNKLSEITKNVVTKTGENNSHAYMKKNNDIDRKLVIVLSPDKGLCGGLVFNLAREIIKEDTKNPYYVVIGKKAENVILKLDREILGIFPFGTTLPTFDVVYPIIKLVNDTFLEGKVSEVQLLFTDFTSVFAQSPTVKTILPLKFDVEENIKNCDDMLFEPSIEKLLPNLLKHYLEMILYQGFLDNYASEQASRMIAMKNATDNANDIINELKLEYNKSRQERITNEILDIGSGFFGAKNE
ncbi:MAG: ATP synthase F1 subunit gamma [Candidatus Levybacteria bacterium CG_4_10_14_0_8_um_filter_35_23]|nr:MAG: ATP synthase F1 subunit gamma [Candidatus Levybacteria bacterium CG_4_10_14_0_8_um_filter_35_23]